MTPTRPVLRWHGGKWLLAPWIIENLPAHRVYVEPYGGAASVLIRKPRSYAEIYNDLDGDVVNLFRILRDPLDAPRLVEAMRLTPFARDEFDLAYEHCSDGLEQARRLIVRSFMGFGSDAHNVDRKSGFRIDSMRSGRPPSADWQNYPDALQKIVTRLQGVGVENRDACRVMLDHDSADTLHYVDPPYVHATRSTKVKGGERYHSYRHEMDDAAHARLLEVLRGLKGKVVLSGYPSPLYEAGLGGWRRVERPALADGARLRTEVLWLNHAAADPGLFGEVAA